MYDFATIPKQIKISSKLEDNSLEKVRRRLRSNNIDHMKFDASLIGEVGNRYFGSVYDP